MTHHPNRLCQMATAKISRHSNIGPDEIMQLLNWVPQYKYETLLLFVINEFNYFSLLIRWFSMYIDIVF